MRIAPPAVNHRSVAASTLPTVQDSCRLSPIQCSPPKTRQCVNWSLNVLNTRAWRRSLFTVWSLFQRCALITSYHRSDIARKTHRQQVCLIQRQIYLDWLIVIMGHLCSCHRQVKFDKGRSIVTYHYCVKTSDSETCSVGLIANANK